MTEIVIPKLNDNFSENDVLRICKSEDGLPKSISIIRSEKSNDILFVQTIKKPGTGDTIRKLAVLPDIENPFDFCNNFGFLVECVSDSVSKDKVKFL